eukprot:scaffold49344_cov88-Cyclotella_meneghiniana.AAC.2
MRIHIGHIGIRLLAHIQYIEFIFIRNFYRTAVPREYGRFGSRQSEGDADGELGSEYLGRAGFEREGACDAGRDFEAELGFGGESVEGRVCVGG